jgi:antitoxin (DNA-binding transcriptional repressor) of toxin-antitoxin stability system
MLRGVRYGEASMKSVGIREAKARLSELARDAAKGEVTMLTDYGKPIATIAPIEQTIKEERGSDAGEFREALLSLPYHLDLGF